MRMTEKAKRGAALLTGGVLMATALFQPAPAQAAKKSKSYRIGAIALGALGAYYILEGKPVPGAIAGAGAYYAYKQSKKEQHRDEYSHHYPQRDRYPDDDFFSRNSGPDANPDSYPGEYAAFPGDPGYDGAYNGLKAAPRVQSRAQRIGKSRASRAKTAARTVLK